MRGGRLYDAPKPPGLAVGEVDDQPHFICRCRLHMDVAHDLRQRRHPRKRLAHRYFVKPLLTVVLAQLALTRDSCPGGDCQNPLPHPRGSLTRWGRRKDVHDLLLQRHGTILEH